MRLSKFNVYLESHPTDDTVFAYNTLTKGLAILTQWMYGALVGKDASGLLNDGQMQYVKRLKKSGILIEDSFDENNLINYWFNRLKFSSETISARVLTTLDCNLDCKYCYEMPIRDLVYMKPDTARHVVRWFFTRAL